MMDQTSFNLSSPVGWRASLARSCILIIAAFYTYGAAVHVMNMLSLTGFDWASSPVKWQVLDWVYLLLDVIVAIGLVLNWTIGFVSFFCAAISQIVLYTVFRTWIVDVPAAFQRSSEELAYLDTLVIFHCVTIVVMIVCLSVSSGTDSSKSSNRGQ